MPFRKHELAGLVRRFKITRFGALLFLVLASCSGPPVDPPADKVFVQSLTANKTCYAAMASRLINLGKHQKLRLIGLPEVGVTKIEVDGPVGEPELWKRCFESTSVQKVVHDSWAETVADMRGNGEIVVPNPTDHAVWFTIFQGMLTGGIEKGLLYVSNDSIEGVGNLVESIDNYSRRTPVPEHGYVFQKLDQCWYIFYTQH